MQHGKRLAFILDEFGEDGIDNDLVAEVVETIDDRRRDTAAAMSVTR